MDRKWMWTADDDWVYGADGDALVQCYDNDVLGIEAEALAAMVAELPELKQRAEAAETALTRIANWSLEKGFAGEAWLTREEYLECVIANIVALAKEAGAK